VALALGRWAGACDRGRRSGLLGGAAAAAPAHGARPGVDQVDRRAGARSGQRVTEQAASSCAEIATTPVVLDPMIDELGLRTTSRDLARRVASTLAPGTMVIDISVAGGSRAESADIANAVGRHLVRTAGRLSPAAAASEVRLRRIAVAQAAG
jgi:succinoglycan biosynthesis transport protein ExoP